MKKITAKFINDNLVAMSRGEHVFFRGAEYWMRCKQVFVGDDLKYDTANGTIYWINADRKLSGAINGDEYAKVVDGVAYKLD